MLFLFSLQMQYDFKKLTKRSIPFTNRKYKGKEKTRNERKNERKKAQHP